MLHYNNLSLKNIEGETWLPINGYEGIYEVSSLGRVKSLDRISYGGKKLKGVIKKQYIGKRCGYLRTRLSKNNKGHTIRVHLIVGRNFIPNPLNKPQINHKKGIKIDNRASELEWNTASENVKHACDMGLIVSPSTGKKGADHYHAKLILDTQTGVYYGCLLEASFATDISKTHLSYMLRGVRKNKTSLIYV